MRSRRLCAVEGVAFEKLYVEFEASIVSPKLKQVARHWHELCELAHLPRWSDIRPREIKAQLPIVWCYDYDVDREDFIGRLAGAAITGVSNKPFKGTRLSALRPVDKYPRSLIRAKRVIQEPALYRGYGLVYKTEDSWGIGERIAMPLGRDGAVKASLFGATEYVDLAEWCSNKSVNTTTEIEHWFSLADAFASPLA